MFCAHCGHEVESLGTACPSCGLPASGAPAPPGGRSAGLTVVIVIGVVLGLIGVTGIVAAIAIPNLLNAINRSRAKRTVADIRTIGTAVDAYAVDHRHFPEAASIAELASVLEPTYVRALPMEDGWRSPFEYECWRARPGAAGCDAYVIVSGGRDTIIDLDDLRRYAGQQVPTTDFDCDIAYSNGIFVQFPDGI
jgi:type II secretory pathway pseudopilin PulG